MNKQSLPLRALLNALGVAAYIAIVATFFRHAEQIFGNRPDDKLFAPMAFLLLFVFSALVTGSLVLLAPIRLYLDGRKTEGVKLLLYTTMWLGVITVVAITILAFM